MSEFCNVNVVREANVYFDGAVTSRTILFPDGSRKTLGIMQPGEYTFSTGAAELMEILSGSLQFRIGDSTDWAVVDGSGSFTVPADSSFTMRVTSLADYCCSFIS